MNRHEYDMTIYDEMLDTLESRLKSARAEAFSDIPKYARGYFDETVSFALLCVRAWHILDQADDLDTDELACINERLYEGILPERYEISYVNPTVAVSAFGVDKGRLLSAVAAELRAAIPCIYERDARGLIMRIGLILEIYSSFVCELSDSEEVTPEALKDIFYSYVYDNMPEEAYNKLLAQLDPARALINLKYASADLRYRADDIIRSMYLSGEYVTDNEILMARELCTMPAEDLRNMAHVYTSGYVTGFEVTGRDLRVKDTAELRFNIGFIPMLVYAERQLNDAGLKCSMTRAGYSIFTGRSVDKNGVFGANPNPQFDLDHKNDLSLIIDADLNQRRLGCLREAFEKLKDKARVYAGPAVVDIFGEPDFTPMTRPEAADYDDEGRRLITEYMAQAGAITNEYIPGDERSFTIIAYPMPSIAESRERFKEIFDATVRINTLDYELYRDIQQRIIDTLDTAEYIYVKGSGENMTDMRVRLHTLEDSARQTNFENCVADVNIPLGEVFTSPLLTGTNGTLHVTHVFLNGMEYHDLRIDIKDGMITGYGCAEGDKLIEDNILHHHDTLPMGECAIGTNTTAYVLAKKLGIESKLPILIAEKTGPHFAFGDTCYSHSEELAVYNPDGKEIIVRDNECSLLRKTSPERAYFNCHTDITIPYDELGELSVIKPDGSSVSIIIDGRFVLAGCEELNRPFTHLP